MAFAKCVVTLISIGFGTWFICGGIFGIIAYNKYKNYHRGWCDYNPNQEFHNNYLYTNATFDRKQPPSIAVKILYPILDSESTFHKKDIDEWRSAFTCSCEFAFLHSCFLEECNSSNQYIEAISDKPDLSAVWLFLVGLVFLIFGLSHIFSKD